MNNGKKKSVRDYGHDDYEWGFKDDYEKTEWEEHYERRNRKWRKEVDEKDEQFRSKSESMESIDTNMEDET
ncbi:hypothetical protein HY212_00540 [Candidatus Pacearchaeota archaeon]|nr:hypothetical protein [Candidatus Pacearchaeota archaeon]